MGDVTRQHSKRQDQLPPFLRDLLAAPPRAGEGVHPWLFRVARHLHAHLPAGEIIGLLENRIEGCGRAVTRNEIVAAVQSSLPCAWQPCSGRFAPTSLVSKWPALNPGRREAIIREGGALVDLWEASKLRPDDYAAHTEEIIDHLFPGNPLLCCGKSQSEFDTKPRETWRGQLTGLQFVVPSSMTGPTGLTKEGRESAHALSNTGPRRFLVCEFDTGTTDEHAALMMHLGAFAPLVCVVHSGGKSLHGWFFVGWQPEEKVNRFFRYAVSLGADHATWTRSQFVRMPDGTRQNGRRQTVFYVNFKPLEARHAIPT
jgi:hypothetical protein